MKDLSKQLAFRIDGALRERMQKHLDLLNAQTPGLAYHLSDLARMALYEGMAVLEAKALNRDPLKKK